MSSFGTIIAVSFYLVWFFNLGLSEGALVGLI